jgi:hypothetical protein
MEYLDSRLDFQYLCVFDTDGINKKISPKNVKNAVRLNDWVALFANQSGPYYDIYALRKAGWVSDDCFKEMKSLQDSGLNETLSFELAVRSKMLRIPETHSPIEVDSAFGGFAIYKAEAVRGARYWRPDVTFRECEHVIFNRQIHAPGRKLIVPSLINAKYTEHTYILRGGLSGWLLRQQGIRDALKIAIPKTLHRSISITISKLLS